MKMAARIRSTLYCAAVLTLAWAVLTAHPVAAQEGEGPATFDVEVRQVGVPVLSQIPYVNKLFKNVGVSVGYVACDAEGCQVSSPGQQQVVCQQPCCEQVSTTKAVNGWIGCGESEGCFAEVTKFELITSLTEAMSQVAALEATLEAREEFERQKEEMFSSLAEAMIENAKLEARADQLHEQLEMQAEFAKARVENANLQSKLEFIAQREQIVKAYSQSVAENQRLKARLAKLEKKHSDVMVAKKAKAATKTAKQKLQGEIQR